MRKVSFKHVNLDASITTLVLCISLAACAEFERIPADNYVSKINLSGACNLQAISADGEYLPIQKVRPNYPTQALTGGLEGYVIVEFEVTETGSVRNIKVVEANPSRIFNQAAIDTAQKFSYQPVACNGEPFVVSGVQNKITWAIEESEIN